MECRAYPVSPVHSDSAVRVSGKVEADTRVDDLPASQNSGCEAGLSAICAAGTDVENPRESKELCTAGYCGHSLSIERLQKNHQ